MIASPALVRSRSVILAGASIALVCGLSLGLVVSGGPAQAAATDIDLGTSGQFAVLAGSGITNTGPTTIAKTDPAAVTGDVGSFPTASITGTGPGADAITTVGTVRGGDGVVQGAKPALRTAFTNAAAAQPPTALSAGIGGATSLPLAAGVYKADVDLLLTGPLVLDGQGDASSVFIFQVGQDMTTASSASISLINGAQACHVYWQIGRSATFGTSTAFKGTVMAGTSITANNSATFEGRLLANDGAVTLDTNTITVPACAAATTPAPVTTTPAPTTPAPTATTPTRGVVPAPTTKPTRRGGDSPDSDDDSTPDEEGDSDSGSGGGTSTDGGGTTTSTGTGTGTGIPNAGGPSGLLLPIGIAAVVGGAGLAFVSRPRRGQRRA